MLFRTIVKTACMFSLVAVVACDHDVADVEAEAAEVEAQPPPTLELAADDGEDDGEHISVDPNLDLRDAEDGAAAGCWHGEWRDRWVPSGTCGGCTISGSYPGLKFLYYRDYCYQGTWIPWSNSTKCEHC